MNPKNKTGQSDDIIVHRITGTDISVQRILFLNFFFD